MHGSAREPSDLLDFFDLHPNKTFSNQQPSEKLRYGFSDRSGKDDQNFLTESAWLILSPDCIVSAFLTTVSFQFILGFILTGFLAWLLQAPVIRNANTANDIIVPDFPIFIFIDRKPESDQIVLQIIPYHLMARIFGSGIKPAPAAGSHISISLGTETDWRVIPVEKGAYFNGTGQSISGQTVREFDCRAAV